MAHHCENKLWPCSEWIVLHPEPYLRGLRFEALSFGAQVLECFGGFQELVLNASIIHRMASRRDYPQLRFWPHAVEIIGILQRGARDHSENEIA